MPPRQSARDPLGAPHLSFGDFTFVEHERRGQRGGGARELARLLKVAQRTSRTHQALLQTGRRDDLQHRTADLLATATQRATGARVRDDATRLSRALLKRKQKKRQSAKKWGERLQRLQDSVDQVVEQREQNSKMKRMRREKKKSDKEQKKGGKGGGGAAGGKMKDGKKSKSFGGGKGRGGGGGGGRGGGGRGGSGGRGGRGGRGRGRGGGGRRGRG